MKSKLYSSFIEPALIYGGILGILYMIISIIVSVMNAELSTFKKWADIVLPLTGLIFCLYLYRKEYLDNEMSYGQAFGMGLTIMVVFGLCAAIFSYIYTSYINTDFFTQIQSITEEKLLQKNFSADDIEMMIEKTAWLRKPFANAFITLASFTFWGTLFSLIIAAFLKKENKDPFKDVI